MHLGSVTRKRRLKRRREQERLKFRRMHVRKGDLVQVLCGKDAGVRGKVLEVYPRKNRVLVEKVNIVKRHQRPNQQMQKGGIISKENPIHISNVMLVCKATNEPSRYRREVLADGKKVRVAIRSGEQIDRD